MAFSKSFRCAALILSSVAVLAMPNAPVLAIAPLAQDAQITRIGKPTWQPVDFHLFSAPVGTAASGYAEFVDTMKGLLPPPHHIWRDDLGIAPGSPHRPPYDTELKEGVKANGYRDRARFESGEFSGGNGIWLVWMTVPAPGVFGSSPDFGKGRIIQNALFPIRVKATTMKDGAVFNAGTAQFDVPALTTVTPSYLVDGASHFPIFIADAVEFGPPGSQPGGSYEYQIDMVDAAGNGWHVVGRFAVKQ